MNVLAKEVQWSSNQCGRLWFFDKNLGEDVRLVNDSHLLDMFAVYKAEMCCQVLGVFDNAVSTADDYAELERRCCQRRATPGSAQIPNDRPEGRSSLRPEGLAKEERHSLPTPARLDRKSVV